MDVRGIGHDDPGDVEGDSDGQQRGPAGAPNSTAEDSKGLAREDRGSPEGSGDGPEATSRETGQPSSGGGPGRVAGSVLRTPLFAAEHSERYGRQQIITAYEDRVGATLIVVIDQIFPGNMTYLEELLFDADRGRPLHLLLASPGGDGESAIRMVRSIQSRCSELTVVVPDMAKSAATLLCLGADRILMGPGGDLGPVDPQFQIGGRSLASAKEIVSAVDEAERRIQKAPETYPLFATLLSDVNMLMVLQARSALSRSEDLVREALSCGTGRTKDEIEDLANRLKQPLIEAPTSHGAVVSATYAKSLGLPVVEADPESTAWQLIWALWTRYFTLGAFPNGQTAVYEGRRASHIRA